MYTVKEIFHTLQGEGVHAGRSAVFLRFAGCNLWSGQAEREGPGACAAWCDTDFVGTNPDGGRFDDAETLAERVRALWPTNDRGFVVCTGGEPTLQLDVALIYALAGRDFSVAIETNGTRPVPEGVDWIAVSPKMGLPLRQHRAHELKLVYPHAGIDPADLVDFPADTRWLIPCDGPGYASSLAQCIAYCKTDPRWRLGIQLHKVVGLR